MSELDFSKIGDIKLNVGDEWGSPTNLTSIIWPTKWTVEAKFILFQSWKPTSMPHIH